MTMMFFSALMLFTSMFLFLLSNPLSYGIIILIMALLTTMIMSVYMSSWICFMIFLIYISGMMVLFSYFVAMVPNIPLPSPSKIMASCVAIFTLLIVLIFMPMSTPVSNTPELYIYSLYTSKMSSLLIALAMILLFTMFMVVKLVMIEKEPLRPFMYV